MTRVFIRLKWRMLVSGVRRTSRTWWGALGVGMAILTALAGGIVGLSTFSAMRVMGEAWRHRVAVLGPCLMVFGWWFGPLAAGGVDETVDPARLVLLPLDRTTLRRGQIAAGMVGFAPMAVLLASVGVVVGGWGAAPGVPLVLAIAVVLPFTGLIGSRAIATSLARMSRTRRGGDLAALIAGVGAAAMLGLAQVARALQLRQLDAVVRVLRWTPPGMAGEGVEAAREGRLGPAAWRLAVLVVTALVAAWWWSRQLDRLMVEPVGGAGDDRRRANGPGLAIFDAGRRWLPRTATGASLARELVYLVRSPARRAALLAGTVIGVVYVVVFAVQAQAAGRAVGPWLVLLSPMSMLFGLQYASNQFGVDPGSFWLEVATGGGDRSRIAGRQLFGMVAVLVPVAVAGLTTAVMTGGWRELAAVALATIPALGVIAGAGSWLSPVIATPMPDSGNPFARRGGSGAGCLIGLVNGGYLLTVAALIGPVELLFLRAFSAGPVATVGLFAAVVLVDGTVWRVGSRLALRSLVRREPEILVRLDARLTL